MGDGDAGSPSASVSGAGRFMVSMLDNVLADFEPVHGQTPALIGDQNMEPTLNGPPSSLQGKALSSPSENPNP
eukprot:5627721-Amphidinium_carterae.1